MSSFINRLFHQIPVAWLQLTHNRVRLWVALAGISFAVILIFMQMGLRAALFESAVRLHTHLQGDIFLISPRSTALIGMSQFSERRLAQAKAFPAVERVSPVYVDYGQWKNPATGGTRQIFVIGIEPLDLIFTAPDVLNQTYRWQQPDTVLFDRASRPEFGPIVAQHQTGKTIRTELRERQIVVAGTFLMGASFGADGNVLTSTTNFLRIFNQRSKGLIDIGLIQLQQGTDATEIATQMRLYFPPDVRVLTKQEYMEIEKNYWQTSTAIGFIFDLGVVIGVIVGIVFVYQVLFTDVSHHLREYATLRAMGFQMRYLFHVVFQEALILAVLGYIPGFALTLGIYDLTQRVTLLPVYMDMNRAVLVLGLTVFMCGVAGVIAVQQLRQANPADIF